jgi:hypothetical protein
VEESEKQTYVSENSDDGRDIYEPAAVSAKKFKLILPLIGREVNLL